MLSEMASIPVDPDWWRSLFDERYLVTDARSVCNDEITRREVGFLLDYLRLDPADRILDLCGGHGRHSLELARRGFLRMTVLDYSAYLLRRGSARADDLGLPVRFVQADARETGLRDAAFDFILVMANSFGYFPEDRDNFRILREARRLCRPGGRLLLDLLDPEHVVGRFRPRSVHQATDDIRVEREREIVDGLICVRERVVCRRRGLLREGTYCERLYEEQELVAALHDAGFASVNVQRDFASHSTPADYGFMTQRVIVTARAEG